MSISILPLLDIIGLIAFSVSGVIAGVRKQMDVYGVFLLAIVTAMGGGTIRDVLVGHTPATVLVDPIVVIIPLVITGAAFFGRKWMERGLRTLLVMDAIGLGVFTISGVSVGIDVGVPVFGAVILGIITSTAGGITRDLLSGEIPLVLRKDVYASASLIGGVVFWLLRVHTGLHNEIAAMACTLLVIAIRVISVQRNWHLPYPHHHILSGGDDGAGKLS